ncbi:UNVERIFIED_CONTAM: hypothetical protein C7454_12914 [Acidovorax defluvii]
MPSKLVSFQSAATNAAIESFLDTLKAEYFRSAATTNNLR